MANTELETLLVTVEADLRRYSKQMQQLGQMTDGGFKKASKAANDAFGNIETRSVRAGAAATRAMQDAQRSSRQFGQQLQNVGYQVGDFFVQLEGGQGVVRALTQQGSQVLGAFGPWGAILGAAAGAAGALGTALLGMGEEANKAAAATDSFKVAQTALGGVLTETQGKVSDTKDALSLLQLGYASLAKLALSDAIKKNNEAIAESFNEIKDAGDWEWVVTVLDQYDAAAKRAGQTFAEKFGPGLDRFRQSLDELGKTATPTLAQIEAFIDELMALQGTVPGAEQRIRGLLEAVAPLIMKLKDQADRTRALNELNEAFARSGGKATTALQVLGFGFVSATTQAADFGNAVRGAVGAMDTLSNMKPTFPMVEGTGNLSFGGKPRGVQGFGTTGQTFGKLDPSSLLSEPAWVDSDEINKAIKPLNVMGLGFAKVVPEAVEFTESLNGARGAIVDLSKAPKTFALGGQGLAFGGAMADRPDLFGGTFGQDNPAFLESSKFSDYEGGVIKEKKPKAEKAEKRTPEDRAEDRTQALKDEIAYNEQLAAVYGQGIEARNRVTASYEALKEARKTGLAEGSKEFQQFVDTQTAQNVVNLGLEHRLDLMKQGQTLTESVMTDQERLNKLLAEYKAMLDAGAIGNEVYKRAVETATNQNQDLISAIEGVGGAIESGIQDAESFADALEKIGLQLLQLVGQGLFGQGPLGGIINGLLGVAGGGILGTPAGAIGGGGATAGATVGGLSAGLGTGFRRSFAAGGMGGPGPILTGEQGPEIVNMPARGYVTPASATRRLLAPASKAQPMHITVSGAKGNQEIMRMISVGVAEGVRQSGKNVPGIQNNYNLRFAP